MINEKQIDELIQDTEKIKHKSSIQIINELKNTEKPEIKNEKSNQVSLGDLGVFEKVREPDIDYVFDKLNGFIFKLQKCMFRVNYTNKSKRRFSVELINEAK